MPVDFRISDLPTSIPFNNLDLMEVSQVDSESPSGYSSVKKTMEEIGEKLNNDIQYASALATTNKKIIPAINEVNSKAVNTLSGLTDTTITTPTANQVLAYDGSKWVNGTLPTTCTITKGSTMPASFPVANLQRFGNICILFFSSQLPARTYANSDVLWNITPVPKNATRSIFLLGNTPVSLAAYNSGEVRFNTSQTLASDTYLIGEIVFYTDG